MLDLKEWLDLGIGLAFTLFMSIVFAKTIGRKYIVIYIMVLFFVGIYVSNYFGLTTLAMILGIFEISNLVLMLILNSAQIRRTFFHENKKKKKTAVQASAEKEKLIQTLNDAVLDLSKTKTGALITVETTEDLKEFIDKGVKVDAKVSSSLLRTIFYPGTPLHDGAVIIKDDVIEAGAVFYVPTTRAMVGKFGARHRAAIGFSEQHEGVTIVVSEETGRISICYQGELIHATQENFAKKLAEYLNK